MEGKEIKHQVTDEDGFIETHEKKKPTCNIRSCYICNKNYQPRKHNNNSNRRPQNFNIPPKYCLNNCQFCTNIVTRLQNQEESISTFNEDTYFTVFF